MEKKMTKAQLDKELRGIALKGILDGSFLTSLCIYPEGTITNNQYIIKIRYCAKKRTG